MVSKQMMSVLQEIAILFPAFLLVFTVRGFFRALISKLMGDDTAQRYGFLTLNPTAHVNIFGLTIVVFVLFGITAFVGGLLAFGLLYMALIFVGVHWTYPVPFDDRNFKNLKLGGILTILGGPLGCFLLAYLSLYFAKYLPVNYLSIGVAESFRQIIRMVVRLSIYFGVFGLLPLPPFSGGKILRYILPYSRQGIVDFLEEHAFIVLICILFVPGISDLFWALLRNMHNAMYLLLSALVI
jgi:Zn-dependent protease